MPATTVATSAEGASRATARRVGPLGAPALLGASVSVVGAALVAASGGRGVVGHLGAQGSVGVDLGLALLGFAVSRPLLDGACTTRQHLRRWLLRIVPSAWSVATFALLFPVATGADRPTTAFDSAAVGTTSVPLASLARSLTFTDVYRWDGPTGPVAHLAPVAAAVLLVLLAPLLARAASARLGATVAAMALADLGLRAALAVGGASRVGPLSWLPAHLGAIAIGLLLAACATSPGAASDAAEHAVWRSRLRSSLASPAAAIVGAGAASLAVLAAGALWSPTMAAGSLRALAVHLLHLVAVALIATPWLVRDGAEPEVAGRWRVGAGVGYAAFLWTPIVIGRWASAPAAPGAAAAPARHPGSLGELPVLPTLAWTVGVTAAAAATTWWLVQRPLRRYEDRPIGTFAAGLWTIALASFATRLWAIGTVTGRDPGNGDPFYYHAQANMLADGVGFGEPIQWITEGRFVPTAIHPPLFTLWLTPASLLGARGYLSHKVLAALAGVAVVAVAALLAKRLAGPRAGLLAGAAVALYPDLFIIDGTLWPEGLYTAVVGAALVLAYRWREQPTTWGSIALGASVGAAVLVRGEAVLLLPLLCAPLVLAAARRGDPWLRHGALMAATAVGLVAPWTVRNLVQFEERVPISTNSEEVLFYANCDDTYAGRLIGYWSFNCQERARQERVAQGLPADPPGDESQRAAGWGALGRAYANEHRDRWPAVTVARVTRAWDVQHSESTALALQFEGRPHAWSVRGYWALRLSLLPAIAGLVILRRRRVAIWPLVAMAAMVTITAVGVYGHPRFRTVGDLVLLVAAAVAIDALIARVTGRAVSEPTATPDLTA